MARKRKKARRGIAAARITDEELIRRLDEDAPHVLSAQIEETVFNAAVEGLLKDSPSTSDAPHFYCRKCREYHLKTHDHYSQRR